MAKKKKKTTKKKTMKRKTIKKKHSAKKKVMKKKKSAKKKTVKKSKKKVAKKKSSKKKTVKRKTKKKSAKKGKKSVKKKAVKKVVEEEPESLEEPIEIPAGLQPMKIEENQESFPERKIKKGKLSPNGKKYLELAKKYLEDKKEIYFLSDEHVEEILDITENALLGARNPNKIVEALMKEFPLPKYGYRPENFNKRIFTDLAALAAEKLNVSEKTKYKLMNALIEILLFESKIPCHDDLEYDAKHDQMARQVRNLKLLGKNDIVEQKLSMHMFLRFFWDQEKINNF